MGVIDPSGLWGEYVHRQLTTWWAKYVAGYPHVAAIAIGNADNGCDSGKTGPLRDVSYHLDRGGTLPKQWHPLFNGVVNQMGLVRARITDSRIRHFFEHLTQALAAIRPDVDDPQKAAYHLGMALHPLQDWVAHGDHAWTNPGRIGEYHNKRSPQREFGNQRHYPDDPKLDAVGGCDGRPEGRAIKTAMVNGGTAVRTYAIYERGTKRLNLTRKLTLSVLEYFQNAVRTYGGPKSKAYFLDR